MNIDKQIIYVGDNIMRHVGWTPAIKDTVRQLVIRGRQYHRIQEAWCNIPMNDEQLQSWTAKESRLIRIIRSLVQDLPQPDDGPWTVHFEGDPRGIVVKLITVDGNVVDIY